MRNLDFIRSDRNLLVGSLVDAGTEFSGNSCRCPFHDDRHPSAGIFKRDNSTAWLYRCHGCEWTTEGKSTGDVFDVVRKTSGCSFDEACSRLGVADAKRHGQAHASGNGKNSKSASATDLGKFAADAHQRLMSDKAALEHLFQSRGVDAETAKQFRLGITGEPGRRYWTFPIERDGQVIALKSHAVDGQKPKCQWNLPDGVGSNQIYPIALDAPGSIWLCPGELKALAVASIGRKAIGITSGEGNEKTPTSLSQEVIEVIKQSGEDVAIPCDDDDTGKAWGLHIRQQLSDVGIEARVVDYGANKRAGVKDIGDFITQRLVEDVKEPTAIAATLDNLYRRSDPWHGTRIADLWSNPSTWQPVETFSTGWDVLDQAIGGGLRVRAVTMLVGKPGHAKSQCAVTMALKAARAGTASVIFSLELGADEIAQLAMAQLSDIPRSVLSRGTVHGEYANSLGNVREQHANLPLDILDDNRWRNGLTRDSFARLVADGVKRFGWRVVVLDYLGLMAMMESDSTDYRADVLNSTALRAIARENNVALVVVAALRKSQAVRKMKPEELMLDDVMGAGRLVYDASSVLHIWRKFGDIDTGLIYIKILKVRYAPMPNEPVQLRWRPQSGAIEDLLTETGPRR